MKTGNLSLREIDSFFSSHSYPISGLAAFRGKKGLHSLLGFILGRAENHPARLNALQFTGLEVAKDDDHSVLHLFDRDEVDEARDDGASCSLAEVDFLDVE